VKLLALQRRMARDIMRPRKASGGSYLKPNGGLSSLERLEIYHRQYWHRLLDSLAEDFPGLRAIVGERAFTRLATAYLSDCPSRSFTLRDLGSDLYKWLRANPARAGRRAALALDMVRFEWARIEAFDGPALRELGPEHLAELDPNLRLRLQPYVRPLELRYPVDEFSASLESALPRAGKAPLFLAVYRDADEVCSRRVEPDEFKMLRRFARGGPLEKLLPPERLHQKIAEWLAAWAESGWLSVLS
jgi:hypothetical protein